MMKRFDMRVSLAVCFAAMIWGAVAHAETGSVTVKGVGAYSCAQFIATIGNHAPGETAVKGNTGSGRLVGENSLYQQWVMGFATGFNATQAGEQQIKGVDLAAVDLWMRNWCNQHPEKMVFDGAVAFIAEMRIWGNPNRQ